MLLKEKQQFVKEFAEKLKDSKSVILTQYQGLDVPKISELRRKLKDADCTMQVIKNRLAVRAIDESGNESYAQVKEHFKGPTAVLLGGDDPTTAIKIFNDYSKDNKLMEFKAAVIMERLLDKAQVEKISDLPTREVMIAQTVMMLNSPIQGFYNIMSGIIKKMLYALNDLKDKKEKGELPGGFSETPAQAAAEEPVAAAEESPVGEPAAEAVTEAAAVPETEIPAEEPVAAAEESPVGEPAVEAVTEAAAVPETEIPAADDTEVTKEEGNTEEKAQKQEEEDDSNKEE